MARILNEITGPTDRAGSRYKYSRTYVFEETGKMSFEIFKRRPIPISDSDQYTVISSKYEYRPDLLANDIWGFTDYWWAILAANNIWDIYDFKIGKNIRIPAMLPLMKGI